MLTTHDADDTWWRGHLMTHCDDTPSPAYSLLTKHDPMTANCAHTILDGASITDCIVRTRSLTMRCPCDHALSHDTFLVLNPVEHYPMPPHCGGMLSTINHAPRYPWTTQWSMWQHMSWNHWTWDAMWRHASWCHITPWQRTVHISWHPMIFWRPIAYIHVRQFSPPMFVKQCFNRAVPRLQLKQPDAIIFPSP